VSSQLHVCALNVEGGGRGEGGLGCFSCVAISEWQHLPFLKDQSMHIIYLCVYLYTFVYICINCMYILTHVSSSAYTTHDMYAYVH